MANLAVLPSPVRTHRCSSHNGIKRRYRSPSLESVECENAYLAGEEQEVDSRPRKTRKLGKRPSAALAIPTISHVQRERSPGSVTTDMEDVDNQGPASISPAAFAEAMDGVLTPSNTPSLPAISISPAFTSQAIPAPSLTPPNDNFTNNRPDWWFPTGDLVLGVENIMFRVHKRVLARNSVVFEDMFALSEPSSDGDTVENVPSVQLHDSAADWMGTLSWLYTGRPSYHAQSLQNVAFSTIKSHLTISNKYDMPVLRSLSQVALERMYPADSLNIFTLFCNAPPTDAAPVANAPSALLLAHQCDVPKVLPAVVYHLLTSHNIDHITSSLRLPLDLQKGYSALRSVASYLCTNLSIPRNLLHPGMLFLDAPYPFQALPHEEFCECLFGDPNCFEIVQRRWLATLAQYTVNRIVNPSSSTGPPDIPLFKALRDLERRTSNNNEALWRHPCENCYWVERALMSRLIGMIFAAIPWWFGL